MERYGTADVLELRDVARPAPGADEVLVRVQAASVNDWDLGLLQGPLITRITSGLFTPKVKIIGGDIAGCVEAVGGDVKAFRPGDEVYGDLCMNGFGAFAEYVCAPEACLVLKPSGMSFEQAAAIPQAGMLAVQGLIDVGRIQSGQQLLLNGAGGGVGTFALQMAKLNDVEVTVVDKPGKLDMLRALGADHVIDYLEEDFTTSGQRLRPDPRYEDQSVAVSLRACAESWRHLCHRRRPPQARVSGLGPESVDLAASPQAHARRCLETQPGSRLHQ